MKTIIRILLAATVVAVAAPAEVSAQGFLKKLGNAVEKATQKVDDVVKKADEALNGSNSQQQQQSSQQTQTRTSSGSQSAAAQAPTADPWISLGGVGPFTLGKEWRSRDGFTVTPLENGDLEVKEDTTGEKAFTYYAKSKQIEVVSPYFKIDEGVAVGSTLAGVRGVMGEAWRPFRVLSDTKQRLIAVSYSYGLYMAFKVEDLADGGAKWDADVAAGGVPPACHDDRHVGGGARFTEQHANLP